mgnify:CR=1 FL=1
MQVHSCARKQTTVSLNKFVLRLFSFEVNGDFKVPIVSLIHHFNE